MNWVTNLFHKKIDKVSTVVTESIQEVVQEVKQEAAHVVTDLMHRKPEVKEVEVKPVDDVVIQKNILPKPGEVTVPKVDLNVKQILEVPASQLKTQVENLKENVQGQVEQLKDEVEVKVKEVVDTLLKENSTETETVSSGEGDQSASINLKVKDSELSSPIVAQVVEEAKNICESETTPSVENVIPEVIEEKTCSEVIEVTEEKPQEPTEVEIETKQVTEE